MTTAGREFDTEFLLMLGVRLVELRRDFCAMELTLESRHFNKQGSIHGGVSAALLDGACAYATIALDDESPLARGSTLMLSVSFTGQAKSGVVRAEAQVDRRGRKIAYCSARLTAADGSLIATAQGTLQYTAPGAAQGNTG
jgi:uncharacterized protein (TIGR00369 family)